MNIRSTNEMKRDNNRKGHSMHNEEVKRMKKRGSRVENESSMEYEREEINPYSVRIE